jgi:hypothetical protein
MQSFGVEGLSSQTLKGECNGWAGPTAPLPEIPGVEGVDAPLISFPTFIP